jgi:biopolymer transport protein ExbB
MNRMKLKKKVLMAGLVVTLLVCVAGYIFAQQPAAPAPAAAGATASSGDTQQNASSNSNSFWGVIVGSGWVGVAIWIGLFGCSIAVVTLTVDCYLTVSKKKLIPDNLVTVVREAMGVGDLMKAIKSCDEFPSPLANILKSGFTQVEEGFEVIQEAVGVAADMEVDKLMTIVGYLNVAGNLAPMFGLLGTVQGMIWTFTTLATTGTGAAQQALLALSIGQALWTTAIGLVIAIPATAFFQFFKNRINALTLQMQQITMDSIKVLRNVEVVVDK